MNDLQEILTFWKHTPPDWLPFCCLITGKAVRKPFITRIIESLILGGVSAGLMLYVGHQVLKNEVENMKLTAEHTRTEVLSAVNKLDDRVSRLQDCIMIRTCTK